MSFNHLRAPIIDLLVGEPIRFFGESIYEEDGVKMAILAVRSNSEVMAVRFFVSRGKMKINWYDGKPISKDGSGTFRLGIDGRSAIVSKDVIRDIEYLHALDDDFITKQYRKDFENSVLYGFGRDGIEKRENRFFAFFEKPFRLDIVR